MATIQFENPFGRIIEEVAVVRDAHDRARKFAQELFQPLDAFCIEVVGGFVEQEHVGLGKQQTTQCHATFFTTRQIAHHCIPGRQAQGVGGDFHLMFDIVGTAGGGCGNNGFKFGLFSGQRIEVGVGIRVRRVDLIEALARTEKIAQAFLNRFAHRVLGVQLGFLRQVADLDARHRHGLAFDFAVDAGHDLQKGGLARAVQTQHTDFGTRKERQRDVAKNLPFGGHNLAHPVHCVYVLSHSTGISENAKH